MKNIFSILTLCLISINLLATEINKYQTIIDIHFPRYKILEIDKHESWVINQYKDGYTGEFIEHPSIIAGNFNYDKYPDFAAIIYNPIFKSSRGLTVKCFGTKDLKYNCSKENRVSTLLIKHTPRAFTCIEYGENGSPDEVSTRGVEIDSIGYSSDKDDKVDIQYQDGEIYRCQTPYDQ